MEKLDTMVAQNLTEDKMPPSLTHPSRVNMVYLKNIKLLKTKRNMLSKKTNISFLCTPKFQPEKIQRNRKREKVISTLACKWNYLQKLTICDQLTILLLTSTYAITIMR